MKEVELKSINKEDYSDTRSYQMALMYNTNIMKKLLQETAEKKTQHNRKDVVDSINTKLQQLAIDENFDTSSLFQEYEELLDLTIFKEDIHKLLSDYFDFLKHDKLTNAVYQKVKRNSTTMRKLRQEMIVLKVVKVLYQQNESLEGAWMDAESENESLKEELQEKTRQLDEIYAGYSAEDESLDRYMKYKKFKADGLTDTEIAKILGMPRTSLTRLLKSYEL